MSDFWGAWTNSTGSSIVTMCDARVRLIQSRRAASVVDLPDPVGPVTSTRPRGTRETFATMGGSPSSSIVRTFGGIMRSTAPDPCSCRNRFTRKRAIIPIEYPKSASPVSRQSLRGFSGAIGTTRLSYSSSVSVRHFNR
jgi:hypothetical protein